jgi:VWFA-related protein
MAPPSFVIPAHFHSAASAGLNPPLRCGHPARWLRKALWQSRMRELALLLLVGCALPALAAKKVTVERLEQILTAAKGKSDGKVADQLLDLQLTERAGSARVARWESSLPGRRSREALIALVDPSAFLDLPAADIPAKPVPDAAEQQRILALAVSYAGNVLHQLPNFLATRETTYFEDAPTEVTNTVEFSGGVSVTDYRPLHVVGRSSVNVAYRDGQEVPAAASDQSRKTGPQTDRLTSSGEFGPILGTVIGDALHGAFTWSHWEQGPTGPQAVLHYAVPLGKSRYKVFSACDGRAGWQLPAYHGEIAIDPVSGSILRLTVVVEMSPTCQVVKVDNVVEYGPVEIGGNTHICPLKSISMSAVAVGLTKVAGQSATAPQMTQLNDVSFSQYHLFGAETRILTEANAGKPAQNAEAVQPLPSDSAAVENTRTNGGEPATAARENPEPNPATNATASSAINPAIIPEKESVQPGSGVATGCAPGSGSAANQQCQDDETHAAAAPSVESAPASSDSSSLVLHANANLVLVDVVVTERVGAVHGLNRDRFRILEDGRAQTIASFDEHRPGNAPAAIAADNQAPLPAHTYSNAPIYPQDGSVNVLLLDGLNTPMEDQAEMRRQVIEYLSKAKPGATFAIFTLASRLQLIRGFSTDAALLISAVDDRKHGTQQSALLDAQNQQSLDPRANELATSAKEIALIKQNLADNAARQTDVRVKTTLAALRELAAYLGGIPGRKNLIWLSGSFPITLEPNDQLIDPLKSIRDYSDEVRRTNELLAAARVAVYPVDARGVMTQTSANASYKAPPNVAYGRVNLPAPAQDDKASATQTQSEHAAMERIADGTGGKAFIHTNDLKSAVESALEDGSSYYTIGYVPPAGAADGKFHRIQVQVEGKGISAAYRGGYFAKHASKDSADDSGVMSIMASAATYGAPPATEVLFKARVLDAADPLLKGVNLPSGPAGEMAASLKQPVRRYVAELTVDPHSVTFDELADGKRQLRMDLALVAYDAEGARLNYLDRTIALSFSPAQLASIMAEGIRVRMALDVPAGIGSLRIAVEDIATARAGSLEVAASSVAK